MAAFRFLIQTLALAAVLVTSTTYAHEHAHEETSATDADATSSPFESSVMYDLQASTYALKVCATSADVATEHGGMIFALLPLASSGDSDASAAAAHAAKIFTAFASDEVVHKNVKRNTTLAFKTNASAPDVLYRAVFSGDQLCVEAALPVAATGVAMVFAEHGADEVSVELFDASAQPVAVLKCHSGCEDHEAEHAGDAPSNSWWGPVGASLVISLTSFVGVVVLGLSQHRIESVVEYMTSFAAGCLLGVVVFHLYPEGSEYLGDLGEWVMGVWVLAGVAFSMAIESGVHMVLSAFGADHHHAHGGHAHGGDSHHHLVQPNPDAAEKGLGPVSLQAGPEYIAHPTTPTAAVPAASSDAKPPQSFSERYIASLKYVEPVAWITAVGDFFHAFTDGVVLAVAFKSCSSSLGWAVALGVVLHEVPHRVGDFFIYIKAGMVIPQALVLNFIASLASLLGAVILLAAGSVSNHALGYLMGFGSGALAFIGLTVLLPPMLAVRERRRAALHFFWFSLGCVLIGLSVLQHKHCDAAGGSESAHSH
ncbi:hypothetical protein PybrP1_005554 [[Pythium] brassicae (nom. inval.)]|nr:hypothetical protein PybrP1_005554 [[Pythium] brassicae (nom. inval.)]